MISSNSFLLPLLFLALFSGAGTAGSAMNGNVSLRIGVIGSTLVFMTVGSAVGLVILAVIPGERFALSVLIAQPPYLFLPGLFNLGMIAVQLRVLRVAGMVVLSSGVFLGQMIFGLILDNFGFVGAAPIMLTWQRILSVVIAVVGLRLILSAHEAAQGNGRANFAWAAVAVLVGCVMSLFSSLNANLADHIGLAGSALCYLFPGSILLGVALKLGVFSLGPQSVRQAPLFYLLVPGAVNFAQLFVLSRTVSDVGVGTSIGTGFFFRWHVLWPLTIGDSSTWRSGKSASAKSWG